MATETRMNWLDWVAMVLIVVGALNWGLIGLGYFVDQAANWNLVNVVFDSIPAVEFTIYVLVGLAALWTVYLSARLSGMTDETTTSGGRPRAGGGSE